MYEIYLNTKCPDKGPLYKIGGAKGIDLRYARSHWRAYALHTGVLPSALRW